MVPEIKKEKKGVNIWSWKLLPTPCKENFFTTKPNNHVCIHYHRFCGIQLNNCAITKVHSSTVLKEINNLQFRILQKIMLKPIVKKAPPKTPVLLLFILFNSYFFQMLLIIQRIILLNVIL